MVHTVMAGVQQGHTCDGNDIGSCQASQQLCMRRCPGMICEVPTDGHCYKVLHGRGKAQDLQEKIARLSSGGFEPDLIALETLFQVAG